MLSISDTALGGCTLTGHQQEMTVKSHKPDGSAQSAEIRFGFGHIYFC